MESLFYAATIIVMVCLALVLIMAIVGLGMLIGKKDRNFALMILLCLPVVAAFIFFRLQTENHHSYVSVVEQAEEKHSIAQAEAETARQTAIRTHIELLEKQLEAEREAVEREAVSEPSEADQKSGKPKPSPGEAAVAEKEKRSANAQLEKTEKLLEKAKQELQQEKEKARQRPQWLSQHPVIEKKNWQKYLAHPETIPDQFIISSGRFTTVKEAQSNANRLAKVTISAKLKALTGQQGVHYDEAWYQSTLLRTYDEALQVKILNGSPTTMHREHLLVKISPEHITALLPALRETIVEKRIYTAAGGIAGVMLMSGLLSVVLSRGKE